MLVSSCKSSSLGGTLQTHRQMHNLLTTFLFLSLRLNSERERELRFKGKFRSSRRSDEQGTSGHDDLSWKGQATGSAGTWRTSRKDRDEDNKKSDEFGRDLPASSSSTADSSSASSASSSSSSSSSSATGMGPPLSTAHRKPSWRERLGRSRRDEIAEEEEKQQKEEADYRERQRKRDAERRERDRDERSPKREDDRDRDRDRGREGKSVKKEEEEAAADKEEKNATINESELAAAAKKIAAEAERRRKEKEASDFLYGGRKPAAAAASSTISKGANKLETFAVGGTLQPDATGGLRAATPAAANPGTRRSLCVIVSLLSFSLYSLAFSLVSLSLCLSL